MIDFKKVNETFDSFLDLGLMEDRYEYALDDFTSAYPDLNEEEIGCLYCLVQDHKETGGITVKDLKPEIIKEYLEETIHNGFDGWRKESIPTLISLIADMNRYARNR